MTRHCHLFPKTDARNQPNTLTTPLICMPPCSQLMQPSAALTLSELQKLYRLPQKLLSALMLSPSSDLPDIIKPGIASASESLRDVYETGGYEGDRPLWLSSSVDPATKMLRHN